MRVTVLIEEGAATGFGDVCDVLAETDACVHDKWEDLGILTADVDEGGRRQLETLPGVAVVSVE